VAVNYSSARCSDHSNRSGATMIRIAIALALLATPALAQQQQPSFTEQAMGQKIMQEINNGLACSARLIEVQKQLETAEAKVKQLEGEAKPAPKTQ
jgi:hypothetical protein